MTRQCKEFLSALGVPENNSPITVGRRQHLTARAESHCCYPICMFLKFMDHLSITGGKHFDQSARAAESHLRLIGPNIRSEHRVIFLPQAGQALAAYDVPQGHASGLSTMTTAGNQQ